MSILIERKSEYKDENAVRDLFNYCARYDEETGMYHVPWQGAGILDYSAEAVINSFLYAKSAFDKRGGKQCYHLILSFAKKHSKVEDNIYIDILNAEVSKLIFNEGYQNCYFVHTDSDFLHTHFIINSVNVVTGYKLSKMEALKKNIFRFLKNNYSILYWQDIYYNM